MCVRTPEGVTKEDVQFGLTAESVSVGVRGFPPLLEGQLYAAVDPEASAWIIKNHKRFAVGNVYSSFMDANVFIYNVHSVSLRIVMLQFRLRVT